MGANALDPAEEVGKAYPGGVATLLTMTQNAPWLDWRMVVRRGLVKCMVAWGRLGGCVWDEGRGRRLLRVSV